MLYKGVKIDEIFPVVYLGEEYKNNDWRTNELLFYELAPNINYGVECPIEDLIVVLVNYNDNFEPLPKHVTMDEIFNVTNDLINIFGDKVKINIHLDGFIEGYGNSIDLTISEFVKYLYNN